MQAEVDREEVPHRLCHHGEPFTDLFQRQALDGTEPQHFLLALAGNGASEGASASSEGKRPDQRSISGQRVLSHHERDRLLEHAGPALAIIATALFTGMRVMEVLALQWGDIDFTEGVIHVRFQLSRQGKRVPLKTKAAKRDIVLMETLGKLLRRRRIAEEFSTDTDFVFQSSVPRRPMTYRGALLDLFHDARKNANLEDVIFHCLRHTFASILIAQGRDVQFVSRQLGHTK